MRKDNPFVLTFGKRPNEYISRHDDTYTVISTFSADNPVSQAYIIEGIRGSGKTVLMTTIINELCLDDTWECIDLNSTQDLMGEFAMRLSDLHRKKLDPLKSGFSLSVAGVGIGINADVNPRDNVSIIEDILGDLKKKNKKLLITIDEVQHDNNMKHFASEFQILLRRDYPIFLLMTGLYENLFAVQNDPALTFLLRTPHIDLEPLNINQVARQYGKIFNIDKSEAINLAKITRGYAFAFQALGMIYWEHRDNKSFDEIIDELDDMLEDFVYKKIWQGLSDADRRVILAVSRDEVPVKEICELLSMKPGTFSRYRDKLIKRGIMVSAKYGYVSLALPRFYEIMQSYR